MLASMTWLRKFFLITGSPRLVQSLIAGDVDVVFAGVTALTRARAAPMSRSSARRPISQAKSSWSAAFESPSRGRFERRDYRRLAVRLGSRHLHAQCAGDGRLKPDKDVTILQLGGHPQVAAAMVAGKLDVGALAGLPALTVERSGGRLLTSAVELKILSPSGTFATTRDYIRRKRTVVERLTRSFVEAIHFLKTNRPASITLLQKYFGGLSAEETAYLYDEQADLLERLPAPNDKALQAVLERDRSKDQELRPGGLCRCEFFREIEKSGLIEQLYRK